MPMHETYLLHLYRSRSVSGWQWAARLDHLASGRRACLPRARSRDWALVIAPNHFNPAAGAVPEYSSLVANSMGKRKVSIGVTGSRFTMNGKPEFLLGISYYAALGASDDVPSSRIGAGFDAKEIPGGQRACVPSGWLS
jgi:hypothetical protein